MIDTLVIFLAAWTYFGFGIVIYQPTEDELKVSMTNLLDTSSSSWSSFPSKKGWRSPRVFAYYLFSLTWEKQAKLKYIRTL